MFRYENCKRILQAQLAKNEQSIKDVPSDSVSLKGLHTRLQEIQVQYKFISDSETFFGLVFVLTIT